jgi:fluoride exporter
VAASLWLLPSFVLSHPCPLKAYPLMGIRCTVTCVSFWGDGLQKYLLIAVGGALGSIARYWVGSSIAGRMGVRFPYGTLIVNITACVIIGFSMTYLGKRVELNQAWRFLVPVGFIGAYSTFSTYEWETLTTMRAGAFGIAALYAAGSFVLGLAAVWSGSVLGEMVP